MRKKLFINDNTMEQLQELADQGHSFSAACKALKRSPWHVRDSADAMGLYGELQKLFPRLQPFKGRPEPPEPTGANMRQIPAHNIKAQLHIPRNTATTWLTRHWRAC